jgi:hypothetical protein
MAEEEKDEIHRIEKDTQQSGFPLEIEVTAILKKSGWDVQNQVYYQDKDEGKPRSVDVIATKAWFESFGVYDRFSITLVIECKKSVKPWVFFMTSKSRNLFEFPFFYIKNFSQPELEKSINFIKWSQEQMHYVSSSRECAVISYEPFKEGKGQEILEATHQVTKALKDHLEFCKKAATMISMEPAFLLYPVIVFDGHIFEYAVQNEDLKISRSDYVQFLMGNDFLIDVIERNSLPDYLKMVDEEITTLKERLKRTH